MGLRWRVDPEKGTDGLWRLVVWQPTRIGHHRFATIPDAEWRTKKEALKARKRVTLAEFEFSSGRVERRYGLRPE